MSDVMNRRKLSGTVQNRRTIHGDIRETILKGDPGITPDLQIGTITTGEPGSAASASITGTPEEPELNLTIPRGDKGDPGYTPQKETDYWTDEDKAEMENDILQSQTVTGMQERINALGENKADKVESATDGNFASLDENGNLQDSGHKHSDYLTQHQDITGKADKVASATAGNFAGLDENGNLQDSGSKASDFLTQHQDLSNYATKEYADQKYTKPASGIPGTDLAEGVIPDISGKADKVSSPTSGNFAALDENGNMTDSGHKHSDYLTQHQSISGKADKVSGATSGNFASLDGNGNLQDSGHKHSDYLTQHQSLANYVQKGVIADDYDPSSTYDVGDRVMRNGTMYRCKTAITTAEAWNASHWESANVDGELSQLFGDLSEIEIATDTFYHVQTITTGNAWSYKDLFKPVSLKAGKTYLCKVTSSDTTSRKYFQLRNGSETVLATGDGTSGEVSFEYTPSTDQEGCYIHFTTNPGSITATIEFKLPTVAEKFAEINNKIDLEIGLANDEIDIIFDSIGPTYNREYTIESSRAAWASYVCLASSTFKKGVAYTFEVTSNGTYNKYVKICKSNGDEILLENRTDQSFAFVLTPTETYENAYVDFRLGQANVSATIKAACKNIDERVTDLDIALSTENIVDKNELFLCGDFTVSSNSNLQVITSNVSQIAVKIEPNTSGSVTSTLTSVRHTGKSLLGMAYSTLRFSVQDSTKITSISVAYKTSDGYNLYTHSVTSFVNGINEIRLESWDGINVSTWGDNLLHSIQLTVVYQQGAGLTIFGIEGYHPQKAKLIFMDDAGYNEILTSLYPRLSELGVPTTWNCQYGRLGRYNAGSGTLLTEAQISTLATDSMSEFSFHMFDGEISMNMSEKENADNTLKSIKFMREHNIMPNHVYRGAWMNNRCNNHKLADSLVDASGMYNAGSVLTTFPFQNKYNIPRIALHGDYNNFNYHFRLLRLTHCVMVCYTHSIAITEDITTDYNISTEKADTFVSNITTGINDGWLEGTTISRLLTYGEVIE